MDLAKQECEPVNVRAWLFRCVRFRALNMAGQDARRRKHHEAAASQTGMWFQDDLDASLRAEELTRVLHELNEHQREIVVARIWGELTFEEIASLVSSSTSAVHRQYHAALNAMQDRLSTQQSRTTS